MATDTDAAHGAAESVGMPQLDFSTFPNQIFWLIVTLVAIYMILDRVALPRLSAVLAERSGTISNDLAAAEDLKHKAADAEKAYNKALADARSEAQRIAAEAREEIQAEVNAAIALADEEISARAVESEKAIGEIRAGAVAAVREVAAEAAKDIVAMMGGKADDAAIAAAVQNRVKG